MVTTVAVSGDTKRVLREAAVTVDMKRTQSGSAPGLIVNTRPKSVYISAVAQRAIARLASDARNRFGAPQCDLAQFSRARQELAPHRGICAIC